MSSSPDMASPDLDRTRHKPHDALTEVSTFPQPEGTDELQSREEIDTRELEKMKLSPRGLEVLENLSGKRLNVADIEFAEEGSRDGGTFSDVVAATLIITGCRVAVKKLRFISDMAEQKFFNGFVNEARLVARLSHPNIVELTGFVEDMEKHIGWLVFPWEDNGNLRQFLGSGTWELPERVSLIYDVASGLAHLHTRRPPICHGDLKSLNILVNSSNRAVITDFGSARAIEPGAASAPDSTASALADAPSKGNETTKVKVSAAKNTLTLTGPACSVRWAPPEYFDGKPLDLASAIWALGWIGWEAITDRYPFEEIDSEVHIHLRVIDGKLPMIHNDAQLSQIRELCGTMEKCWSHDPRARLSAIECQKAIQWIPMAIPSTKSGHQSRVRSAALLMQIGEIRRSQGRLEEASTMLEQALAIARSDGDQTTLVNLLIRKADGLQRESKYVDAEATLMEALVISERIGDEERRADAMDGLGDVRRGQCRYVEAGTSYSQALAIYESIQDHHGRANALKGLGDVHQKQSKYVEAEAYYVKAAAIYKSIGEDVGRANVLLGLGDLHQQQSKDIEAKAYYAKAAAIYKSIGNDLGRANALKGLGDVHQKQSKYAEAKAYYVKAAAIHKRIGEDVGRANALLGLGEVHQKQSKYVEAEAYYVEAAAIHKSIGEDLGRANALLGLGDIHQKRSKYVEADAYYVEALALYKSIGVDLGEANALRRLGKVHQKQSKYIEAEAYYVEALAIYKSIGDDLGRANALVGLGDVHQKQSQYVEAEAYYAEAVAVYKSIGATEATQAPCSSLATSPEGSSNTSKQRRPTSKRLPFPQGLGPTEAKLPVSLG